MSDETDISNLTESDTMESTNELSEVEKRTFGIGDTWESVAARLGVPAEALFTHNCGLGGCFTMQMVPVASTVTWPPESIEQDAAPDNGVFPDGPGFQRPQPSEPSATGE